MHTCTISSSLPLCTSIYLSVHPSICLSLSASCLSWDKHPLPCALAAMMLMPCCCGPQVNRDKDYGLNQTLWAHELKWLSVPVNCLCQVFQHSNTSVQQPSASTDSIGICYCFRQSGRGKSSVRKSGQTGRWDPALSSLILLQACYLDLLS